jgi:hypothetical protein
MLYIKNAFVSFFLVGSALLLFLGFAQFYYMFDGFNLSKYFYESPHFFNGIVFFVLAIVTAKPLLKYITFFAIPKSDNKSDK